MSSKKISRDLDRITGPDIISLKSYISTNKQQLLMSFEINPIDITKITDSKKSSMESHVSVKI